MTTSSFAIKRPKLSNFDSIFAVPQRERNVMISTKHLQEKNLKFLHDDKFCCAGMFLQQLVQPDLSVGLKDHTQFVDVNFPLVCGSITSPFDRSEMSGPWPCRAPARYR